ncbi:30S ribosomal protein S15 [Candidatus Phytoplasma solani]|uniref:30S ribosomal protein S15 n=1 Tax=Candidatus Phytoplasma solani TaxID=69896 RepID=UPI0003B7CB82|nr:30S ribosomal protein S15 [Candidatus Phytoplasma solani]CCP88332.1 30S ribosomal protein S15 [Candidatus Phytoplasma solani]CCP88912.1 30S ribosomal protein S15 [Candidatus Phytoplasma solani]
MALTKEQKQEIITPTASFPKNTGSTESQIKILSNGIKNLSQHLKNHPKDFSAKRGLFMRNSKRRRLLKYLAK